MNLFETIVVKVSKLLSTIFHAPSRAPARSHRLAAVDQTFPRRPPGIVASTTRPSDSGRLSTIIFYLCNHSIWKRIQNMFLNLCKTAYIINFNNANGTKIRQFFFSVQLSLKESPSARDLISQIIINYVWRMFHNVNYRTVCSPLLAVRVLLVLPVPGRRIAACAIVNILDSDV